MFLGIYAFNKTLPFKIRNDLIVKSSEILQIISNLNNMHVTFSVHKVIHLNSDTNKISGSSCYIFFLGAKISFSYLQSCLWAKRN